PNQEVYRSGGRVKINNFGMRSDDITLKKPDGVHRVFMIGDSTLYGGSYIDQESLFSEGFKNHLNNNLDKIAGNPKQIELLSMGVNAWGPRHEMGYLRQYGFFGADHFIIVLPIGDLNRPKYGLSSLPYFHKKTAPKFAWEEIIHHLFWRYQQRIASNNGEVDDAFIQESIGIYKKMALMAADTGARVSIMIIPTCKDVQNGNLGDENYKVFARNMEDIPVEIYSPLTLLSSLKNEPKLYHDCAHFDLLGHKLVAKDLANHFYSLGL
ncbi:MAG: hypothetical protein QNL04_14865, partial [SAR324 cluster bacterium]|nr:hypothetical protein [SAR324 cluster bacterium]